MRNYPEIDVCRIDLPTTIDEESSDWPAVSVQRVDGQPLLQAEHAQRVVLRPCACVLGLAM
jgi:hypothetical protein